MSISNIKIDSQRIIVYNHFKLFMCSVFPYIVFAVLVFSNYIEFKLLYNLNFQLPKFIYLEEYEVKSLVLTISILISYFFYKYINLICKMLIIKICENRLNIFNSVKNVNFKNVFTSVIVSCVKLFLSVSWITFYLFPTFGTAIAYYYAYTTGYNYKMTFVLLISTMSLFTIGIVSFYITIKRYKYCDEIILLTNLKDSIAVINKSINIMSENLIKYSKLKTSFTWWNISCVLLIPLFYVLPYKKTSYFLFYKNLIQPVSVANEKPIIFYFAEKRNIKKGLLY